MALAQGTSANVWLEPAPTVDASTDTPLSAWLHFDGTDWTIVTGGASQDGGIEDDGTGDYVVYDTAHLPGTHTQLQLLELGTDILTFQK